MTTRGFRQRYFPLFKTETWSLAAFIDEVCRYSIGENVSFKQLLPSKRELILFDVADALETGRVQSCVHLIVTPRDGGDPVPIQFAIERSFWSNEDPIAELKGFLSSTGNIVPEEYFYINDKNKNLYLKEKYHQSKPERHLVKIVGGRNLFSDLVDFEPLPAEKWFARYNKKYRQDFTWELIAVAWRYIAIYPPAEPKLTIVKIVNHLENYLEASGMDPKKLPKHSKIYQIARNIKHQKDRNDLSSPVGVSSNSARPPVSTANRKRLK